MLRRLLTLFAILTGLAAIAAPAEAHFARVDNVRVELSNGDVAQCHGTQVTASERPAEVVLGFKGHAPFCPRPTYRVYFPTVQLGIDRAHE